MKFRDRFSLHPFLLAIYPLIFVYAINVHEINWLEVVSISLVLLAITFISIFLLSFIFKNKGSAGVIVSLGIILFFSYGYLYDFIESTFVIELRHRYPAGVYLGLFLLVVYFVVKTKHQLQNVTKILNGISITLVIIAIITIGYNVLHGKTPSDLSSSNKASNSNSVITDVKGKPDIYYIILDEYAGVEALSSYFDYDNQDFISFLKKKGFYVVTNAKSNYNTTCLSMASSMNMKYLECIENFSSCIAPVHCYKMISSNLLMKKVNEMGYRVVAFYSGSEPSSHFDYASDCLCAENETLMNSELLITIASKSMLKPLYVGMFGIGKREQIMCVFSELKRVKRLFNDVPIFAFAHIILPHHPFIFWANGEPRTPKKIEMGDEALGGLEILDVDKEGYLENLKFANEQVKEVVTEILSKSKEPPIIIIQGDHGLKTTFDPYNPAVKAMQERTSILNAYYLPDGKESSLYDTITPVNTFRLIFREYFGEDLGMLDDSSYWLMPEKDKPACVKDVSDMVRSNSALSGH